jgi:predicted TIM-barrel fold metal-dependent hydrolase
MTPPWQSSIVTPIFWTSNGISIRSFKNAVLVSQLTDLAAVISANPDIQFILPLMGWPIDLTESGHREWKRNMRALAAWENVALKIFGMESIFGLKWTVNQIRPWILDAIAIFGPERCMFASLLPIARLACSFKHLCSAYLEIVREFSASEKRSLFYDTATRVYRLSISSQPRLSS